MGHDNSWNHKKIIIFTLHILPIYCFLLLLFILVRRVPPRFSIPPTNQEVMPGGSVNLTCVAVGSPMPYVKWTMGLVELTKEEEMPMGRNVLEVTNIRESANYTCVAISSLGMIEATAQVTVKGESCCSDQFRLLCIYVWGCCRNNVNSFAVDLNSVAVDLSQQICIVIMKFWT